MTIDAAGIVLAGGRSSRMGTAKAGLEWHGSTLLRRAVGVLARAVVGPLVVVRAPGQDLPPLPPGVEVVDDPVEGLGPLQGIAAGLAAVAGRAAAAFVCSTDMPLLHPAFVRRVLLDLGPGVDVVLPVAHGYPQPLAAAYRTALAPRVGELVAAGRLRPGMLFAEVRTLRLDEAALLGDVALAAVDPELESLTNVNSPDEYRAARARPAPRVTVQGREARAATLGAAAAAAGLGLHRGVTVNGLAVPPDAELPLTAEDAVHLPPTTAP